MFGYFVTALAGIFWLFRVVITMMFTAGTAFPVQPINMTFEIVLLFVTFVCIILIAKRNMFGAIVYLLAHCAYFGMDIYKNVTQGDINYLNLMVSIIGVIIPFLAFANIGLSSGKKSTGKNKKADWFYGNEDYDRKFDERADTNQYKF